ncbi:phospholipase-like protein [Tanacetum coccineum]
MPLSPFQCSFLKLTQQNLATEQLNKKLTCVQREILFIFSRSLHSLQSSSTPHSRLQQQLLFFNFDQKNVVFKGHSLHFGRPEFALITGLRFGRPEFCSYTSTDLKFRNRVFPHKVGLVVTILDVLGVIEYEVMFGNLCDEDSVRLCLILALEVIFIGRLLTCPVDDSLFGLVENLEAWNVFPWGEHDSKTNTDIRPTRAEFESSWWIESNVLALERNDKLGRLQFNEDLSRLRGDFVESLNILFQELVDPHDSVEDIANVINIGIEIVFGRRRKDVFGTGKDN